MEHEQFDRAGELVEEALLLARRADHRQAISAAVGNLGWLALVTERYGEAALRTGESLELAAPGDKQSRAIGQGNLGLAALLQDDLELAESHLAESVALCREIGAQSIKAESLSGLAGVAARRGDDDRARRLWGLARAIHDACGSELTPVERRIEERFIERLLVGFELVLPDSIDDALEEALPGSPSPS